MHNKNIDLASMNVCKRVVLGCTVYIPGCINPAQIETMNCLILIKVFFQQNYFPKFS